MSVAEVKTLLTVPEAAAALRIGRSTAYDLAHAWLDSGGTEGLPVVRIGGSLRVPVAAIERLFAIGGFGPAWSSGLDGRRSKRAPAPEFPTAAEACAAPVSPGEPREGKETARVVESGASKATSESVPSPVRPIASDAECAPPEPRTPKPRRPRRPRRPISSSAQLSLFDTPDT